MLYVPEDSMLPLSVSELLPSDMKIELVTNQVIVSPQDLSTTSLEGISTVFF